MKKILFILFFLPAFGSAQIALWDSLLQKKLISQVERDKRVLGYIGTALTGKEPTHAAGTVLQYWRGDKSLATFPTLLSQFTNDLNFVNTTQLATKQNLLAGTGFVRAIAGVVSYDANTYLTAETDPLYVASIAHSIVATDLTHWNAAYSWGNHNLAGYVLPAALAVKADTTRNGSAHLVADFNTSSTTAVNTNLGFAIGANEMFDVIIAGTASKAISSTGLKIAIGAPAGCSVTGYTETSSNAINTRLAYIIAAANTLGSAFSVMIGTQMPFTVHISVVNGSTPGNITLQAATVTSNTATIYAGTKMTWLKSRAL